MKNSIFFFLIMFLTGYPLFSQNEPPASTQKKSPGQSIDSFNGREITYFIQPGLNQTWGYDILVDQRLTIHQITIPGMPGNEGFKTKEGAEGVARLVIVKIKKGEMPPSITIEEMKKIQAI